MVNTSCAVFKCASSSHRSKGVKFHQFPRDERAHIWIQACKRADLTGRDPETLKHMHICSIHFEQRMYGKQLLKKSAIPTINLPTIETTSTYTQTDHNEPAALQVFTSQGVQTDEVSEYKLMSHNLPKIPRLVDSRSRVGRLSPSGRVHLKGKSTRISLEQFLDGCDEFLPDSLSAFIKAHINFTVQYNC